MPRSILCVAIVALVLAPARSTMADAETDRLAAQQIAQNMKKSGLLQDYRVGVKYQDGVAWLMGTVTSVEQKAIAEQIARKSAGVERIVSKLEVIGTSAQAEDAVLTASVDENFARPIKQSMPAATPMPVRKASAASNTPLPFARTMQGSVQQADYGQVCPPGMGGMSMQQGAMGYTPGATGQAVSYENPQMPGYAWPSYAAYPNYAALTYPQQYSPTAWPYIGPFYPYPQVPLGWRKVTLEWDDGWWFLDFKDCKDCH
jgi:hypothetical protein